MTAAARPAPPHPYLVAEERRNRLTIALRNLSDADLDDAAARAEAYAVEGLAPVAAAEDTNALARQRIYWRRVQPRLVVALADMAATRIIRRHGLPHRGLPCRATPADPRLA